MAERGFGPGGPGHLADGSVSFLYCIDERSFADQWPRAFALLATRADVDVDQPGRCLDFVVETSPHGDVERLDLELVDLDVLLRLAQLDEIADACSLEELRVVGDEEAASRIARAVVEFMPLDPTA